MAERESLYRVLQVDPGANQLVIQAAYRVLARIFHPDVEGDDDQMKRLNHAWSVLGDPLRRAEYDRQVAGRHPGPVASPAANAASPAGTHGTRTAASPFAGAESSAQHAARRAAASQAPRHAPARPDAHAGPPQGEPSGPLLTFGRYEGWTIGQVARVDPPFLEWLRRVPAGRQLKDAIDVALLRADGARRLGIRADAPVNDQPVHSWRPGAPTRVR